MRKNTTIIVLFLLVAVIILPVQAQKVGTTSMQFLKVMPTAKATALGDAYVSMAEGSDAVFWNPAGITSTENIQVSGTFIGWLFDTKQTALAMSASLGNWGTIGGQFQYLNYGSFEETRVDKLMFVGTGSDMRYNPGTTGNTFSPYALLIGLTYARQLTEKFSTGVTIKYATEALWNEDTFMAPDGKGGEEKVNTRAKLFLFDFGMKYYTGYKSVRIGISVQNFGGQVKYIKESFPAPLAFRVGAAADFIGEEGKGILFTSREHRLGIAYDLFQPNDYEQQMHVGVEYEVLHTFALRAGYKINYDNDGLTLGFGILGSSLGIPVHLDYSYGFMGSYLPSVQRISIGVEY